ncbi:MAG: adenylosuccinate lyase [Anaerolineae bacterium]|nr:adenylosuccinate lyase [Anaerolineae bacterium]
MQDHTIFSSPFTWRYGSEAMRRVWSLTETRRLWRRLWVALAEVQSQVGLVTAEQVEDLRAHQDDINLERAHELEAILGHDLMAEVHTYAEQCRIGGGIIHLGATSMDIEDNAEALKIRDALNILLEKMVNLLRTIAGRIEQEADHVCMAYTHLQPAEPTTVGYRLAFVAQDMLADYEGLSQLKESIRGKGFKGAVGTSASYAVLLEGTGMSAAELEARIMARLGLPAYDITHQTYPRRQDWQVLNGLASIAMTAYKFAFDLRLLQAPPLGEWHEPFGSRQIGSSAMPFKRNPIHAENIDSLARYVAALPRIAWDNAAHHLLERTLDDSANRRVLLPEAFLAVDEIISRMTRLVREMVVDEDGIKRNLAIYGPFAGTERLLMTASKRGGDRQRLHEAIREKALQAWVKVQQGHTNPLAALLSADERITAYVNADEIPALLDVKAYVGNAPQRARALAQYIRERLA